MDREDEYHDDGRELSQIQPKHLFSNHLERHSPHPLTKENLSALNTSYSKQNGIDLRFVGSQDENESPYMPHSQPLAKKRYDFIDQNIISVDLRYHGINQDEPFERSMKINRDRSIADLYDACINEYKRCKRVKKVDYEFTILFKNAFLNRSKEGILEDFGIENGVHIDVILKEYQKPSAFKKVTQTSEKVGHEIVPMKFMPKPPKDGYKISPEMFEIARMSLMHVQRIKDFKIWNEYGSIQFMGDTDVTEVDLAETVTIGKQFVEVYPDSKDGVAIKKPSSGEKLNKPATVTLKGITCKKGEDAAMTEVRLRERLQKQGGVSFIIHNNLTLQANHVSYDSLK